ncbi:unnamed protein product [Prorocentrum cordatum]|uniref:Nudix hydrolase domain-containing protein n=1 Tax=Prorocentrum cordatum TaxID=2364126 RepID=A0ABN9VYA8_9DINO|nr:unnamed protein product [Polarella glacialis]
MLDLARLSIVGSIAISTISTTPPYATTHFSDLRRSSGSPPASGAASRGSSTSGSSGRTRMVSPALGQRRRGVFTDGASGERCLLLGEERRQDGGYNLFWGFGELGELDLQTTAARECAEESLGLLGHEVPLAAALGEPLAQMCLEGGGGPLAAAPGPGRQGRGGALFAILSPSASTAGRWTQPSCCGSTTGAGAAGRQPWGPARAWPPRAGRRAATLVQRLVCVRARSFLEAARSGQEVKLRRPAGEGEPFAEVAVATPGGHLLAPRPPASWLARALAAGGGAAGAMALWCAGGDQAPGPAVAVRFEAEVHGVRAGGGPSVDTVAAHALFSSAWTGGRGTDSPREPRELAACLVGLCPALLAEAPSFQRYASLWVSRGLDSAVAAARSALHLGELLRLAPGPEAAAWLAAVLDEEGAALLQGYSGERAGSELQLLLAYRILLWLRLAHALCGDPVADGPLGLAAPPGVAAWGAAAASAAAAASLLQQAPRPRWLQACAAAKACEVVAELPWAPAEPSVSLGNEQ